MPAFAAAAASAAPRADDPRGRADGDPHALRQARIGDARRASELADLAAHGATLVIHLGAQAIEEIAATLIPHYGEDCPAAVVARASWPDEVVLRGTLADIAADVRAAGVRRTATILVGPALAAEGFRDSHLYSERARAQP